MFHSMRARPTFQKIAAPLRCGCEVTRWSARTLSMATSCFWMAPNGKIIDLRKLLAERFPQVPAVATTCLITGLPFLDKVIGGGLPKGGITELISPRASAGSASLIHALLLSALRNHYFVALIDGRGSFDPCALNQSSLPHL